jgi:hypothetical protein
MGNAQKPTAQTRHINIKYFTLCEWVKQDHIHLERIDTSINIADHLTKPLSRILFHRQADFLLRHVPPQYSPVHAHTISMYSDTFSDINHFVPALFKTPIPAKLHGYPPPLKRMYGGILSLLFFGMISLIHTYGADCGGVLVYT